MKSRPDYQETTRAIASMNREAGQKPQIVSKRNKCRDDLDPEKLKWLTWLHHTWKLYFAVNRHSENLDSTQLPYQELVESQPRETVQRLRKNGLRCLIIGGMHLGGPIIPGGRVPDGLGLMIFKSSHPGSENYRVCDGECAHTLLSHAHFLCVAYRKHAHAWLKDL